MPIEFGFILPPWVTPSSQATYVDDVNRALTLVSGHFTSVWMIDHLLGVIEGFTTLTYFAALHPALTFGHTVLSQSYRNPALVAHMGVTLQLLTGGRFILGIGTGWQEAEYRAFGYDFPSAGVRVEQLDEALHIIRAMWTQETATFHGRHYFVDEARCEPRPQPVPPILIGAFKPKMLRLAAKYADEWNVSSTTIENYQRMVAEFAHACEDVGRDPATVRRSWGGGCVCARTHDAAIATGGERYNDPNDPDDFNFVGTPDEIAAQMRPFIDLGVTRFMLDCGGFPNLTTLELLVSEVLPALSA